MTLPSSNQCNQRLISKNKDKFHLEGLWIVPIVCRYTTTKRCPTERAVRESVRAYKECADAANDAMESRFR